MPAVSVASRTPSGSVTWTTPLRRKNSEVAGSPAATIFSPRLIGPDRAERGELGEFLRRQSRQQRLLGKLGRLVEVDRAAVAVDDLVLGPFDRGVEQMEVAQVRDALGPFAHDLPVRGRTLDAGQDHRDVEVREFAEILGEQAGAGARHRRDAAQVENDELRARLGRKLARDVIDIGKRQRADQFDDADVLMMRGEDFLLMRPPAAPRRALADVVVGDDASCAHRRCG